MSADPIRTYRLSDKDYKFVQTVFRANNTCVSKYIRRSLTKTAVTWDLQNKMEEKKKNESL